MVLIVPWHDDRPGEPHKAWLLDWSPNGMALVDVMSLHAGDQFAVSVNVNQTKMALYTVRHVGTLEHGVQKIGAELCGFVSTPEEDVDEGIRQLLSSTAL